MEFARVVDIHEWYRDWGIDWSRLDDNFDVVGVRAGVNMYMDKLLPFFVEQCVKIGKPYFTYHIPAPIRFGYPVELQAETYLSWPGVMDAKQCADLEPPYLNYPLWMVSAKEAVTYIKILLDPFWYSNKKYLDMMAWPAALADFDSWLASYPLKWDGDYYRYFEEYLLVYPDNPLPDYFANSIYAQRCKFKQFTKKGDALHYLSVAPNGIKEADLSMSTVGKDEFMAWIGGGVVIEPPPEQELEFMATLLCDCPGGFQNVRSSHTVVNGNEVGIVTKGQNVKAVSVWSDPVTKGNVWVKITEPVPGWTALRYGGTTYLTGGGD